MKVAPLSIVLFVFVALIDGTLVEDCLKKCGISDDPLEELERSLGSANAPVYTYPWIVLLEFLTHCSSDKIISQRCTGFIVTETLILSAAHCFYRNSTELYGSCGYNTMVSNFHSHWIKYKHNAIKIYVGINNLSKPLEWPERVIEDGIMDVIFPSEFNANAQLGQEKIILHDYAVIKLKEPLDFPSNGKIRPICLPFNLPTDSAKDESILGNAQLGGWGATGSNPDGSLILPVKLQHVSVPLIDADECSDRATLRQKGFSLLKHICAGARGRGAMEGDSGSPLMAYSKGRWFAIGLLSMMMTNAPYRNVVPDIYMRTSGMCDFLALINNNVRICQNFDHVDIVCNAEMRKRRKEFAEECNNNKCPSKPQLATGDEEISNKKLIQAIAGENDDSDEIIEHSTPQNFQLRRCIGCKKNACLRGKCISDMCTIMGLQKCDSYHSFGKCWLHCKDPNASKWYKQILVEGGPRYTKLLLHHKAEPCDWQCTSSIDDCKFQKKCSASGHCGRQPIDIFN